MPIFLEARRRKREGACVDVLQGVVSTLKIPMCRDFKKKRKCERRSCQYAHMLTEEDALLFGFPFFCEPCKKGFTSEVQLTEHKDGKFHKEHAKQSWVSAPFFVMTSPGIWDKLQENQANFQELSQICQQMVAAKQEDRPIESNQLSLKLGNCLSFMAEVDEQKVAVEEELKTLQAQRVNPPNALELEEQGIIDSQSKFLDFSRKHFPEFCQELKEMQIDRPLDDQNFAKLEGLIEKLQKFRGRLPELAQKLGSIESSS